MRKVRVLALALALCAGGLATADVQVGEIRAAQAREGVTLRETPRALATVLATLPYGTRVSVLEVQGRVARVTVAGTGATGWVRSSDIVEPPVLTGRTVAATGGAGGTTASDVSAAGRQFDDATEADYKASHAELQAAYPLLDALEKKTPSEAEITAFVRDGRLGR